MSYECERGEVDDGDGIKIGKLKEEVKKNGRDSIRPSQRPESDSENQSRSSRGLNSNK